MISQRVTWSVVIYTETVKEKGQESEQVTAIAHRKEAKLLDINSHGTKKAGEVVHNDV